MSKNKFFKKLLVAGLCALTATATVGTVVTVAGCKKDDGNESEQTREYTVKYDLDGGTWSNANTVKVKDGEKVAKPSNPTKTGYTFVKWIDASDKTDYDFDAKVESDLTLKAVWQVAQGGEVTTKYTVTIDLDGGTWGDNSLSIKVEKDGTLGDALAVAGVSALPTKTGHEFKGWITTSGDAYETDTPVTADITIKASWEAVHQHEWATEWTKDVNGHHKKATCNDNATCETAKDQEGAHVDADGDNKCDLCEYEETNLPAGYTALKDKIGTDGYESVINNTFIIAGKLNEWSGSWGTNGVYSDQNGKDGATYDTNHVIVKDGVATQVDANGASTSLIVDLGTMTGVVEGYCDIIFAGQGNSWTPVQIYGTTTAESKVGEIFGLRIDGGKIKYRVGGTVTAGTTTPDSADKKYGMYFKVDLGEGKVTVKIDDAVIVEDLDIGVNGLTGLKLASSDGGSKLIHADNLIVVNKPVDVSEYKTTVLADLLAAYNAYDVDNKYTTNGADLTLAYETAKSAIEAESANTIALVAEAYKTGIAAMKAVKSDLALYKAEKIEELIGHKNGKDATDYSDEGKAALDKAVTDGTAEINKATDNAGVDAALAAAKTAVDEVPTISGEAALNNRLDYQATTVLPGAPSKVDFSTATAADNMTAFATGTPSWLGIASDNTARIQIKSGYLDVFTSKKGADASKGDTNVGGKLTVTTTSANAVITFNYNSNTNGRYFTITGPDGQPYGDGDAKTSGLPAGAYEQPAKNTEYSITLGAAGTYVFTFTTNETDLNKEHKINSITLTENASTKVNTKVNSVSVELAETPATIADLVSKVTLGLDYNGEDLTEDVTEGYTVVVKLGGTEVSDLSASGEYEVTVIYNGGDNTVEATQYNSVTVTYTVA
ncbi:MAG: InlB B-repeat-containing protein [Clostridia bacterium]|nr:InlB B-repeat-containing protein [Clostridia bacterium]